MTSREFRWLMLKQALLQKKAKALLILLALTMGASVVAALLNLQTDLRSRINRELRDYGPNAVLIARDQPFLPTDLIRDMKNSPLGESTIAYSPQIFVPVKIKDVPVVIVGVDIQNYRKLYPSMDWKVKEQRTPENGIYLGKRLAERLRLEKASTISIYVSGRKVDVPVAGTIETGESEDDQAILSLSSAQQLSGNTGLYQTVLLSVLGDLPQVEHLLRELTRNKSGVGFQVIRKIAAAESGILDKITQLMGLIILLISAILFFCIHTTVSAILISRQSEVALLRVLGARRQQIASGILSELLVLGVVGGVFGYMLGIVMAQMIGKILFHSFIQPSVFVFFITIVFALTLMIVSSFFPVLRAVNRQAALILKEA